MRASHYLHLLAIARRCSRQSADAEDLVQEALLEALRAGRLPSADAGDLKWLAGVVRNRARMAARAGARRRQRETHWHEQAPATQAAEPVDHRGLLDTLPQAQKAVAALILSGHTRAEIAYLLQLTDPALRQRVATLKRHIRAAGLAMPADLPGLNLGLAYGRIRDALLPGLLRQGGVLASHDPDGHLFIVRRSQKR